jgi:hypothetical protein
MDNFEMNKNPMNGQNGWNEWSKYVLKEIERLDECYKDIDNKLDAMKEKVTMLQIKVAGIGAVSSIITTIIILLLTNLLGKK